MTAGSIENVADTAFMVAAWRAEESARRDALFRDPFAARLAGERGKRIVERLRHPIGAWQLAIRTVVIDRFIDEALARGVTTVLNLGAGLDARPYRLQLPEALRWIEADRPEVIAWKEQRLAGETPRCRLERVGLDLADAAARRRLFEPIDERTLVLTEGVVPYLTEGEVAALADDLHARRVAAWIVEYLSPESMRFRRERMGKHLRNAPFRFEPADWSAFFAAHGFRPREMRYLPEEAERLGRAFPVTPLMALRYLLTRPFLSAKRREGFRKMTGFAVLERV